jgi:phage tail tube protein FII
MLYSTIQNSILKHNSNFVYFFLNLLLMEITLKIDQRKKEAKALVEYLRNLPYVQVETKNRTNDKSYNDNLTTKQLAWINRLRKVNKEIDAGTFKGNPISTLMDEL